MVFFPHFQCNFQRWNSDAINYIIRIGNSYSLKCIISNNSCSLDSLNVCCPLMLCGLYVRVLHTALHRYLYIHTRVFGMCMCVSHTSNADELPWKRQQCTLFKRGLIYKWKWKLRNWRYSLIPIFQGKRISLSLFIAFSN